MEDTACADSALGGSVGDSVEQDCAFQGRLCDRVQKFNSSFLM